MKPEQYVGERFKGRKGQWYWRLRRRRGDQIVAVAGEGYSTQGGARRSFLTLYPDVEFVTDK